MYRLDIIHPIIIIPTDLRGPHLNLATCTGTRRFYKKNAFSRNVDCAVQRSYNIFVRSLSALSINLLNKQTGYSVRLWFVDSHFVWKKKKSGKRKDWLNMSVLFKHYIIKMYVTCLHHLLVKYIIFFERKIMATNNSGENDVMGMGQYSFVFCVVQY